MSPRVVMLEERYKKVKKDWMRKVGGSWLTVLEKGEKGKKEV